MSNEVDKIIKEFKPNYGLNLELEKEHQKGDEWIFGATGLTCLAENIPEAERGSYLPAGEVQRGREDMFDCASRGPINILETKFNWLLKNKKLSFENEYWLRENGYVDDGVRFSDAFVAINSSTTRQGNSMKAPLDAIRKQGLIPKKTLPLETDMTWDDYHNPARITGGMIQMGQEFLKRFVINYEKVLETDFGNLLKKDLLNVGGYAWPPPINGEYPRTDNQPNHVFIAYKNPKYFIFDNYLDPVDGDYTKKLTSNYDLMDYGYRLLINKKIVNPKKTFWQMIILYLKELWK